MTIKTMRRHWTLAVASLLFVGAASRMPAQPDSTSDAATVAGVPADWWQRNAATYAEVDHLLWHVEGNYSLSLQRGNVDGSAHNGSAKSWLRLGHGTLSVMAGLDYQDLSLADGVSKVSTWRYRVSLSADVALTERLAPEGGLFLEHDDAAFIEARRIAYLGLRYVPFSDERFTATILPAFGHQHEEAILTGETRSFISPYFEESVTWQALDRLRIEQSGNVLFSLDEPETWRGSLAVGLVFPVVDFLAFSVNYEVRYNSNPIPTVQALRQATGGVGSISKDDHDLTAGIRLQY